MNYFVIFYQTDDMGAWNVSMRCFFYPPTILLFRYEQQLLNITFIHFLRWGGGGVGWGWGGIPVIGNSK